MEGKGRKGKERKDEKRGLKFGMCGCWEVEEEGILIILHITFIYKNEWIYREMR